MRSSSKSRSRNKSSRNRNHNHSQGGNVVNRVFDSSGPEGKVRGTPQQIIDKYQSLARDAQLSDDRVAAENFLQHSEHYSRMLGDAQREMNERRDAQEAQRAAQQAAHAAQNEKQQQQQQNQNQNQQQQQPQQSSPQPVVVDVDDQPRMPMGETSELFPGQSDDSNLVQTPESQPKKSRTTRSRKKPAEKPAEKPVVKTEEQAADSAAE